MKNFVNCQQCFLLILFTSYWHKSISSSPVTSSCCKKAAITLKNFTITITYCTMLIHLWRSLVERGECLCQPNWLSLMGSLFLLFWDFKNATSWDNTSLHLLLLKSFICSSIQPFVDRMIPITSIHTNPNRLIPLWY